MKSNADAISDIFIVGTGTDVGKTVVSVLLMQYFYIKGLSPFYIKPCQTGCLAPDDDNSDAAFVYRHVHALANANPSEAVVYCHPKPKAPFFAARELNIKISLERIWKKMDEKRKMHAPLIIEAAGGLMVPVTGKHLIIDMVKASNCRPLLVAKAGLGAINHTLLSLEALRNREIEPLGVLLNDTITAGSDPELVKENREAIERIGRVKVAGPIPFISNLLQPCASVWMCIEKILKF
ncbi:MAG: dethiobiotin synthase [Desulfobacteraceae bacterium]|nr:dethiobiotin synthase [Desulfobacteraceae bacterium]